MRQLFCVKGKYKKPPINTKTYCVILDGPKHAFTINNIKVGIKGYVAKEGVIYKKMGKNDKIDYYYIWVSAKSRVDAMYIAGNIITYTHNVYIPQDYMYMEP